MKTKNSNLLFKKLDNFLCLRCNVCSSAELDGFVTSWRNQYFTNILNKGWIILADVSLEIKPNIPFIILARIDVDLLHDMLVKLL